MVVMMVNKQIVAMCPNFYKIINFEPMEGDNITERLIRIYQEYLFRANDLDKEDIESIKQLDLIVGKYIDDYVFRKEFQKEIVKIRVNRGKNILKDIINSIIKIFNNYEEYTTRVIYISKWI